MSDLIYLRRRYQKELECIEKAQCDHSRRAHEELAWLYSIRIDMQHLMVRRPMQSRQAP